jgi:hypothetical protein
VVWSLAYEMVFYLMLTALFLGGVHRRSGRYALTFGVAAVVRDRARRRALAVSPEAQSWVAIRKGFNSLEAAGLTFAVAMLCRNKKVPDARPTRRQCALSQSACGTCSPSASRVRVHFSSKARYPSSEAFRTTFDTGPSASCQTYGISGDGLEIQL